MEQKHTGKQSKNTVIGIIGFLFVAAIAFILYGIFVLGPDDGYYIGDTNCIR